jgi:acyl transferase domain-containing protein/NADPH:quinone reductase-like Zn-dependent oxidoreductase
MGAARAAEGLGPLYVGSVKPNVGHTEGCSGLAGLFKAILCLEKGMLVPSYDVQTINPKLTLEEWNLALPSRTMEWPGKGGRRISVNSFGFGGANAHVILDDAYHYLKERDLIGNHNTTVYDDESSDSGISIGVSTPATSEIGKREAKQLFVFSSRDQAGLQRLADVYRTELESKAKEDDLQYLYNLSYTLAARRSHHDFRSSVVASSLSELSTQLSKPVPKSKRSSRRDQNLVFVFTGQGAQWPAMGIQLLSHPVFERSVRASREYLQLHGCEWDALEELRKTDDSNIGLPEYSQTLCTVLQVALVDLLRHWNIMPKATVGHSSGEIAAAYAASYISHSDAVKIAYVRGVSSASVEKDGAMMAAGLSREEAQEYLAKVPAGSAVVACVNSPSSVTLSGDVESIDVLEKLISADNKFARKLKVKTAYHSPHMQGVSQGYLERLGKLDTVEKPDGNTVMFSSLTGKLLTPGELTAEYWVANMCNAVEFAGAFAALLSSTSQPATGGRAKGFQNRWGGFVEVGPHAALQGPVQQNIAAANNQSAKEVPYVSAVMRGKDASESALAAAGQLWASGVDVDLSAANEPLSSSLVTLRPKALADLPTYPWNHSRSFWHEASNTRAVRFPLAARTDLLGMPEDLQNPFEPRWKNNLRLSENPWMEDHKITGTILYPGAGMLIMALEGALQLAEPSKKVEGFRFRNISFERGLVVSSGDDAPVETRLSFLPTKSHLANEFQFTVYTTTGSSWTKHCSGTVALEYVLEDQEIDGPAAVSLAWNKQVAEYKDLLSAPDAESLDVDDFYDQLEANGMEYGPLFRNVVSLASVGSKKAVYGAIQIPDTQSVMPANFEYPHIMHPATMDAIFHLLLATVNDGRPTEEAAVPYHLEDMFVSAEQPQKAGTLFHGYSRLTSKSRAGREVVGNLVVSDDAFSAPRIVARGFALRQVTSGQEPATTATGEPKGVNKCAVIKHTEDVDFIRTATDVAQLSGAAAADPLVPWLTRLIYKKALPHVLLVVDHDQWQSSALLPTVYDLVGQRPGFGKLTALATTSGVARNLQKLWMGSKPVDIQLWDVLKDERLPTGDVVFDLVLVLGSQRIGERSTEVFATLKQALDIEGHLVVRASGGWLREWAVKKAAESLELPRLISIPSGSESFDHIGYNAEMAAAAEVPSEVSFLLPAQPFGRTAALADSVEALLAASNIPVRFTTLTPDNVSSLAGKHVISFLEIESPLIYFWSADDLAAFRTLVSTAKHVLWITRGSLLESWAAGVEFSPAQGLLRVMRNEYPLSTLPYLDLSTAFDLTGATSAQLVLDVWKASLAESAEMEYAELRGLVHITRAVEYAGMDNDLQLAEGMVNPIRRPIRGSKKPLELSAAVGKGDYLWTEDESAARALGPNEVEVEVEFVGLGWIHLSSKTSLDNDKEDGVALPKRAREAVGIVTRRGDNVTSVAPGQRVVVFNTAAAKTHIRQDEALVAAAPESLLPEQVAALPSALVAARYALDLATLGRGQTVLVHDAASVLGQAILQVSQAVGAEAFALVETKGQKSTLVKKLGVPADRVFDSQSPRFVAAVQEATKGRGVDVVVASRAGPALLPSLDVLGDFGYVFDFGAGGTDAPSIVLPPSKLNASLIRVDIDRLLQNKPHLATKLFRDAFSGSVTPIHPTQVFSVAHSRQAVDALKTQRHAATVLSITSDASVLTLPPPVEELALDPNGTYVLAGGLGALGLNIAAMMIERGAKHLVFLSRSGGSKNEKDLENFRSRGVLAEAFKCNVNNASNVAQVFSKLKAENRTIKGVVQCAMVLEVSYHSPYSFYHVTAIPSSASVLSYSIN